MALVTLTKENFQKEVLDSSKTVLVDFSAPWCGTCRAVLPVVTEIADEVGDKYTVGKVNVDEQPELAKKYGVMSIPTLIVVKNGKVVETVVGSKSKKALMAMLV